MSEHCLMTELKYAVVERERRFLVRSIPEGVVRTVQIEDYYIEGTRLRLRQATSEDGSAVRKLGHKVRLGEDATQIACTSFYLSDGEWQLLRGLPSRTLRKTRHIVDRDGVVLAVDQLDDGTLLAEIDDGDESPSPPPTWLDLIREVTTECGYTGVALAR